MVSKIILAHPRGYCAGVTRAIDVVELALKRFGKPIYVRHHIVHNNYVVEDLEKKGAIFVEDIEEIPKGNYVILSAHGSAPDVKPEAEKRGLKVIDAVCPLVTKVHVEARRFHRQGYTIIFIGHRGHQEAIGTTAQVPMHLVETAEDVQNLTIDADKIIYLTQTTLSIDDTKEIIDALKRKFPHIRDTPKEDICYATTNRQGAVKRLARQTDLILVVGSVTSSNSKRLVETARYAGVDSYLVDSKLHIKKEWLENVDTLGITSGASVPDVLVQEVIDYIAELHPECTTETLHVTDENVTFVLPPELES